MRARFAYACTLLLAASSFAQQPYSPHQEMLEQHRDTPPAAWLTADDSVLLPAPVTLGTAGSTHVCSTVFGYLPYWSSSANIRWDLLTHVACFSVEVNANGTLGNDHGWPWTSVVNTAHANGVKAVLVATLFNTTSLETLMTTPAYRQAFYVNIKNKMLEGTTDGVNIDFEGGGAWRSHFVSFMQELTQYLHSEVPGCEVTLAGPAVNWSDAHDLPGLAAACDGIFIMGYAFAGSWSGVTGANAPLVGGSINITDTVLDEYGTVTATMPEKLILGVPYYGHHWTTADANANSSITSFVGSTRFYNDQPNTQTYGMRWDGISQTPWYRWQEGSTWHQVWYDNAGSLQLKYQLAADQGLQGIGMWALDYDGSRPELWDLIDSMFGGCSTPFDFDGNRVLDELDLLAMTNCMNGVGVPIPEDGGCDLADDDGDGDVDLRDFAVFHAAYGQ